MYAAQLATISGGVKTLLQKAIAILTGYGVNAHVYLPGIGVVNGLQAGNYLDYTETIGSEQLANPSFAAATGWTQGSGWMITTNMATATTASGALIQTALTLGQYDQVQVTTTAASAGSFDVLLGGVKLTTISTVGTFTVRGTAGGTTLSLSGNGYTGVVTLASVKQVTGASITLGVVDSSLGQLVDANNPPSSNKLVNGLFTSDLSGWTYGTSDATNVICSWSSGRAQLTRGSAGNAGGLTQTITTVVGAKYQLTFTATGGSGVAFRVDSGQLPTMVAGVGTFQTEWIASNTTAAPYFWNVLSNDTTYLSNISVKQLTGINAFQATSGNRPVLRRGLVNLLTYSQDMTNSAWVKTGTATVSNATTGNLPAVNDVISQTITSSVYSAQTNTVTAGFLLSGTGTLTLSVNSMGGSFEAFSRQITLTSTPTLYLVTKTWANASHTAITCNIYRASSSDTAITFTSNGIGLFAGNVTPTEIPLTTSSPASSSQGNYALEFNGSTNYLQMAQPLFQVSDDQCVIAGFSKANAASYGAVVTCSANPLTFAQQCTISIDYPGSNNVKGQWTSDTPADYNTSTYALATGVPVVATTYKIGNSGFFRVNGSQIGSSVNLSSMTTSTVTQGVIGQASKSTGYHTGSIYPIIAIKGIQAADVPILEKFVGMLTGPSGVVF